MIFIFGYHPIRKNIGPVEERECPNCSNTRHWLLGEMRYWINLFFIPVIPVKSQYYEYCPVCRFSSELTREEYEGKKDLAKLNQEAVDNNLSDEEYEQRMNQL